MNTLSLLVAIVFLILIGWILWNYTSKESYGQDTSVRINAGGLSGPNYGFNPFTNFQNATNSFIERQNQKLQQMGCGTECLSTLSSPQKCNECVASKLYSVEYYGNQKCGACM